MRKLFTAITMLICGWVTAQEQDLAFLYTSKFFNDSIYYPSYTKTTSASIVRHDFAGFSLTSILTNRVQAKMVLGYTNRKKPVEAYFFPGTSSKKALVIGGVHGSELSSVEVARQLIKRLSAGERTYYSVIIIPVLFPDNAATAEACKTDRIAHNVGRYTHSDAIDPNRQLPPLGQPFNMDNAVDAYGRPIERENQLLLQLVQAYAPERIVNIHAIKDFSKGGIYADPRTDCYGRALGFSSDSTLAVTMAKYIDENGGNVAGNKIKTAPTALYYLDPAPAPVGELQVRNLTGANMKGKISGVSLGSWASTAVCDEETEYSRPAMRLFTMEFPGYKKPSEYKSADDRKWFTKLVDLYAGSIHNFFLQEYCVEDSSAGETILARN